MRFTKFGKALAIGALSLGVLYGVTSCDESYTVGFLYVTGTVTASSGNNGIISGFKIDHNTGHLTTINGTPVATGGSNPVRAVLTLSSRFVYVLNRGTNSAGNGNCTPADPCLNANITQFAVGGNGVLTYQETFYTQGINPFRLLADGSGSYLLALDQQAPDMTNCARALGTLGTGSPVTSCGDVTVFQINQTTGRLSLIRNIQVTDASNNPLTYFPVPANPVDFAISGGYLLTLTGGPTPSSYPYTGGTEVWPYTYVSTSGQLQLSLNGIQQLSIGQGTAIVNTNGVIYILDNEPVTIGSGSSFNAGVYPGQVLPFSLTSGGALQAEPGGVIPDDATLANPIQVLLESKTKYLYVANQGNNTTGNNPESGIAGYFITTAPSFQLSFIPEEPFGSGSGPQCIVEDPSDQFVYEANMYSSNVTGRAVDPNSGNLNDLRTNASYSLDGPATWCFIDGRTD
ncbi:MAG: beta-propeller fold lactonase family protein [Terracidiphilus sp.]